jgi:hypothetical protein
LVIVSSRLVARRGKIRPEREGNRGTKPEEAEYQLRAVLATLHAFFVA